MLKKVIATIGSKFLMALANFAIVILTTQFLGAEGKGEVSLFVLNVTIIILFSGFVGGPSMVFLVPRTEALKLLIPSYLWGVLSAVLITFLLVSFQLAGNYALHLLLIALLEAFYSANLAIILGKEKIKTHNIISIINVFSLLMAFFIFIALGKNEVLSYLWALYIAKGITLILSFLGVIRYLHVATKHEFGSVFKNAFRYGFYTQVGNIAQIFNYRLSYYLLEHYWNKGLVGVYATGMHLAEVLWIVKGGISMVQYARIANSNDINYSKKITLILLKISLITTLAMLVVLLLMPTEFFTFIFGSEFTQVKKVIWYLAIGITAFSVSGILSGYFAGNGLHHVNMTSSLIGLVFTVVLGFWLIPKYSLMGAGITATISYSASTLYQALIFMKETKMNVIDFLPTKKDAERLKTELKNLCRS
ncbi:MAG: hypothetical protein COA57_10995 [Flavobacteriales bacterium]|nr:MAG: hypothetical protein COA57_10995 [Flavobacteriales bacterium]